MLRGIKMTVDPVMDLVDKVINFIDTESKDLSLTEYKEVLENLVDNLQSRIEATEHDLEYVEDQ